jgi:diguanylate cyclase (GGDEF)-like protein/PAS domain S-box-containing protein
LVKIQGKSFSSILSNMDEGLYFVDKQRRITYWNNAAERISGFSAKEVVGKSCADNILTHIDHQGTELCKGICPLAACMHDGLQREAKVFLHHKDGHRVPVSVRVNTLKDPEGRVIGGIELFTDLTQVEAAALRLKELEQLALVDQLTGLANRAYLERELEQRQQEWVRYGVPFGLLFMDIDYFKTFNDTFGHAVGDEILRTVAQSLNTNARPFDLFGRWGGEEFLGIIKNVDKIQLMEVAQRIRNLVSQSYVLENDARVGVTISLGATIVLDSEPWMETVSRADSLLYRSKNAGRNQVTFG